MKDVANHFGDGRYRTTVLSFVSMMCNVGFAAAGPVFGLGLEEIGLSLTLLFTTTSVMVLCTGLLVSGMTGAICDDLDLVLKR